MANTDVVKVLAGVNGALLQINTILPAAMLAYTTLYAMWKKVNPEKTFEEFNAELLAGALDVQAVSVQWYIDHGYHQDETGNWVK
jgi:hypothetical protein